MNDFMQGYEYYKKAWEKSLMEKTQESEIKGFNKAVEALRLWYGSMEEPSYDPYEMSQWLEKNRDKILKGWSSNED